MTDKLNDVSEKIKKYNYAYCVWTDKTDFLLTKELPDADKLLEVRCFGEKGEFYAFRSDVTKDFSAREIEETDKPENCFDKEHYLDIDSAKTKKDAEGFTYATGGGKYHLPVTDAEKLIVRFYYTFDDNGIARKTDWRLMGFKGKEGK